MRLVGQNLVFFNVSSHISVAAGFSQEWHSNAGERSQRRQVEVQANIDNNPNRAAEYRTVTTAQTEAHPEFEAEERTDFFANVQIEKKKS